MREVLTLIGQVLLVIVIAAGVLAAILTGVHLISNAERSEREAQQEVGYAEGYSAGYCAALGGAALNADTCNVEGKVVAIVR